MRFLPLGCALQLLLLCTTLGSRSTRAQEQPVDCGNIPKDVCASEANIRQRCPALCRTQRYDTTSGRRGISTVVYFRSVPLDTVAGQADVFPVLERWLRAAGPLEVVAPQTPDEAEKLLASLHAARVDPDPAPGTVPTDSALRLVVFDGTVVSMRKFATHLPLHAARRRLGIYSIMFFENPLYTYTANAATGEERHAATNVQLRFLLGPGKNGPAAKVKEGKYFGLDSGGASLLDGDWDKEWQYFEPSLDYLATRDGWGELVRRLALLGVRGAGRAPRVNLKRPTPSKYSEIVSKDVKKFELFIGKQAENPTLLNVTTRFFPLAMAQRSDYGAFAKVKLLMTCQSKGAYYRPLRPEAKPYENPQCAMYTNDCEKMGTPGYGSLHIGPPRMWADWQWAPADPFCAVPKARGADSKALCDAIGPGKTITFVGDSIMSQMANSMVSLLGESTTSGLACNPAMHEMAEKMGVSKDKFKYTPGSTGIARKFEKELWYHLHYLNSSQTVCGGSVTVIYIRNDNLMFGQSETLLYGDPDGMPLAKDDPQRFPPAPQWPPKPEHAAPSWHTVPYWEVVSKSDVAVLNRGSHADRGAVQHSLQVGAQSEAFKQPMLVWRTTGVAHTQCYTRAEPVVGGDFLPVDAEGKELYGWKGFGLEGEKVISALEFTAPGRFHYLDANGLSNRRIDHHRNGGGAGKREGQGGSDCLHYCLPGPPDEWNYHLVDLIQKNAN